jgi:hypothetical protein
MGLRDWPLRFRSPGLGALAQAFLASACEPWKTLPYVEPFEIVRRTVSFARNANLVHTITSNPRPFRLL